MLHASIPHDIDCIKQAPGVLVPGPSQCFMGSAAKAQLEAKNVEVEQIKAARGRDLGEVQSKTSRQASASSASERLAKWEEEMPSTWSRMQPGRCLKVFVCPCLPCLPPSSNKELSGRTFVAGELWLSAASCAAAQSPCSNTVQHTRMRLPSRISRSLQEHIWRCPFQKAAASRPCQGERCIEGQESKSVCEPDLWWLKRVQAKIQQLLQDLEVGMSDVRARHCWIWPHCCEAKEIARAALEEQIKDLCRMRVAALARC